jgi:hypothetical protein
MLLADAAADNVAWVFIEPGATVLGHRAPSGLLPRQSSLATPEAEPGLARRNRCPSAKERRPSGAGWSRCLR